MRSYDKIPQEDHEGLRDGKEDDQTIGKKGERKKINIRSSVHENIAMSKIFLKGGILPSTLGLSTSHKPCFGELVLESMQACV